jgi:DNA primase
VSHAGTGHHRWRKDRNPAMLFAGYNQNARDHTIASAYSIRGGGVNG